MKANEFFKAMGIKSVRQFIENDNIRTKEMHDDLKRLIESHELIESCGGLESVGEKLTHGMYESRAVIGRLEQAIADVESCQ